MVVGCPTVGLNRFINGPSKGFVELRKAPAATVVIVALVVVCMVAPMLAKVLAQVLVVVIVVALAPETLHRSCLG